MTKEDCLKTYTEGFDNWRKFCYLMDLYPNKSYGELQIMLDIYQQQLRGGE